MYSLSAWSITAAYNAMGTDVVTVAEIAYDSMYHDVAVMYCGDIVGHLFNWFLLISNFASWMAAHGMASRYLYSFSRANLLPKAMEKTNKAKSPFVACCVNMVIGLGISFIMALCGLDPYSEVGAICSSIAIVGIMLIELIVCIAVISYMRKHNSEPGFGHNVFQTTIAPILALIGMGYVLFLVLSNFSLLTGYEDVFVNVFIGGLMVIVGIIGYAIAIAKDKNGTLVDPVDIDVEEEIVEQGKEIGPGDFNIGMG